MADTPDSLFKSNGLSLCLKILIPIILFIGLTIFIFTTYLIKDQRNQHETRLKQKAQNLTYLLIQSSIDALWDYIFEQLNTQSRAFFKDQDIISTTITDHRGNIQTELKK